MCSNFLNIVQIKQNTIPNDSKLHAELKNHNLEPPGRQFLGKEVDNRVAYISKILG